MKKRIVTAAVTKFTMSGTSQATAAFGAQTYRVRVATHDQPAYIRIDDGTPTATANDTLVPAGWAECFDVTPGQKLAVIQAGTAGVCTVSELT